ncbi:CSC1-like protein 1 [Centruroides sculpturatus]|uniref:CSC1-like protein 1 n=1 Tax=Centruroides sculpturatus TaxID=218467 RepID=UPI000C6E0AB1|nr:CSC1-like protein 1 [Centruroides sculpturatus]
MTSEIHPDFMHYLFSKKKQLTSNHSEELSCNIYPQSNYTSINLNTHDYGFIPFNLSINIVVWLFLLILFSLLRKRAWNYGRLALVQRDNQKWTSLFYGESGTNQIQSEETESIDSFDMNLAFDKGLFSWFRAIFKINPNSDPHKDVEEFYDFLGLAVETNTDEKIEIESKLGNDNYIYGSILEKDIIHLVEDTRVFRGFEVDSDHHLVLRKLKTAINIRNRRCKKSMSVCYEKTKVMAISIEKETLTIKLCNKCLEHINKFSYLETIFNKDGKLDLEISNRLSKAGQAGSQLSKYIWNKKEISHKTKLAVYNTVFKLILTYDSESLVRNKRIDQKLEAAEMRIFRKISGVNRWIQWQNHIKNEDTRKKTLTNIQSRVSSANLRWFEHLERMGEDQLAKQVFKAKIKRKNQRDDVDEDRLIRELLEKKNWSGMGLEPATPAYRADALPIMLPGLPNWQCICMVMAISIEKETLTIKLCNKCLEHINKFSYLETIFNKDGKLDLEISNRLSKAGQAGSQLSKYIWNKKEISHKTKLAVYNTVFKLILTYDSESLVRNKRIDQKLEAAEMRIFRKISGVNRWIQWQNHIKNEDTRKKTLTNIQSRVSSANLRWFDHLERMGEDQLAKQVFKAKIKRKNQRDDVDEDRLIREGNSTTYSHTTLTNLNPESSLLWIHVLLSFLFLPLVISFLRHFSLTLKFEETNLVTRTLMVDGIPRDYCYKDYLIQHFQEAYPECIVQDIQFAYDINHLNKLDKRREIATQARIWCEKELNETGARPKIRPYKCGRICFCGLCCKEVDGLDFYMREEHTLTSAVEKEKSFSLLRPLGIAFVTFQNETMAELVYKDHQKRCKCNTNPPSSSLSRVLNPHDWKVTVAPPPEDILWANLTQKKVQWYFRAFFINFGLFIFLVCFTTPVTIVKFINVNKEELNIFNSVLSEQSQVFLLWAVSVILPIAVAYTDQFLFHWTRSSYNHSVMVKTYLLLIFMILILPSLGEISLRVLIETTLKNKGHSPRWRCIFLPDNGALYVNYVITATFIGTAMELIRFPELFLYACYLGFSRSKAEYATIRKAAMWEFEFGVQYAWFLLVFAVVITYSLACPLVVPFGLMYLCFKHCVDRHNIYFAYAPSKISQNIHATAINFVIIAVFLLQVFLFFFSYVRIGWNYITIVSLAILVFTLLIFSVRVSHNWFRQLTPISYKHLNQRVELTGSGLEQTPKFSSENKVRIH